MEKIILDDNNLISKGKRVLYSLTDLLIFVIFTITFYSLAVTNTMYATPAYKNLESDAKVASEKCSKMYEDGHLITYKDGTMVETLTYCKEMLQYKIDEVDYKEGVKTDFLLYFYVDYAPTLHKNQIPYSYTIESANKLLYVDGANPDIPLWDTSDLTKPIHLMPKAKEQLALYLKNQSSESGQTYYEEFLSFMKRDLTNAEQVLINSDEYTVIYSDYVALSGRLMQVFSYSALITFTVLFFIYYLLIPILMKDGRTLGKRFFKLKVSQLDLTRPKKHIIVLRSLLQYLTYFFTVIFVPFFQLGFNCFKLPLIKIGSFSIDMFVFALISLALCVASLISTLVTENRQSLVDKALWVSVVKTEPDYQEKATEETIVAPVENDGTSSREE